MIRIIQSLTYHPERVAGNALGAGVDVAVAVGFVCLRVVLANIDRINNPAPSN
jgi:hypothetical protein